MTCSIEGCDKPLKARSWCAMHWKRWRTHGDTSVCTTNRYVPMIERFWMKIQKGPGCWQWTGAISDGYGSFGEGHKGRTHLAHRFAYELTVGPIPEGMQLDHRCSNRRCVNPAHLRPVTHKQNMEHDSGAQRNSTTGVLGVYRKKNRYVAGVGHNGRKIYGGSFKTLEEAAEAVKHLRLSLFSHNDLDRIAS